MLQRKAQVAVKLETTEGTAVAVAAADAGLYVYEVSFTPDITMVPRNPLRSTLSNLPHYIGKKGASITFKTELVGSGTAGTAPALGTLFQACGMSETIVASTSVTYAPDSDEAQGDGSSASVGLFIDGKRLTLFGARGSCSLEYKAGEPVMASFTLTGVYGGVSDTALLSGITYPTPTPKVFLGETLTLGGDTLVAENLTLDIGNNVVLRPDVTIAEGYKAAAITERAPTVGVDPEEVLGATRNDWSKYENATASALLVTLTGSAGNIVTLNAAESVVSGLSYGDRDGVLTNDIELALTDSASAGDGEYSIVFT